jgi:diamine N-acetyltransferase
MPAVELRPITVANWEEAARLEVDPSQADFIESNLWSIAELQFYPSLSGYAIYARRTMVGFLVWGLSPDDNRPWLYRFMIDRTHQKQGYGRAALLALIADLRKQGVPELNVGYHRDNTVAAHLYESVGFIPQGLAPWGELMARLDL